MIPTSWSVAFSAILFCIGLYGLLARRNAIAILMCIELMLNAANINFVAFSAAVTPDVLTGQIFAIFVMAIAAGEAAVGLAIVIALYRNRENIDVDEVNLLKW